MGRLISRPTLSELLLFPIERTEVPDAQERERALDTTRSFLVEAPAGSGKTGLLIQRYLKLLAGADVTDPAQVLAITFTRKATAEMRERIHRQLANANAGDLPESPFDAATRDLAQAVLRRDQALGWRLVEQPSRLNIQTIDAVCAEITRALPVLAGAAGTLAPTDNAKPLFAEAARRTLLLLGGDDAELTRSMRLLLLHRDGALLDLEGAIAEMLETREQWCELIPRGQMNDARLDGDVLPKLDKALQVAICRVLTKLSKLMPLALQHDLGKLAGQLARASSNPVADSPLALCRELTAAPGVAAADLAHWRGVAHLLIAPSKKDWRKGLHGTHLKADINALQKQELLDLIDASQTVEGLKEALCELATLPPNAYPREQWQMVRPVLRVLGRALGELQAVFSDRGQCDFTETALLARAALRDPAAADDLASASGQRLRHLLVDEMQDTSGGQYDLIGLLTRGWNSGETVFLVGDPKQSIYRFRQARVERFLETMRTGNVAPASPTLERVRLTANFRSLPALVQDFNEDFSRLFPPSAEQRLSSPAEVTYQPAHPTRDPAPGAARRWQPVILPHFADPVELRNQRAAQQRASAEELCRIILSLRSCRASGRTPPLRIAVLARSRAELEPVIQAMDRAGLSYRAVKIDPLNERREILDLLALTRALYHPADRTAWLALLRTPWCGLTLQDIHRLAGGDDPALGRVSLLRTMEERSANLSADGRVRLDAFWQILRRAFQERGHTPFALLVERTWRAFGAPAYATDQELANAEQFFHLLSESASGQGRGTGIEQGFDPQAFTKSLEKLFAAPSTDPDAVELLTIHGAKGLEWDVVLVPSLERESRPSRGKLLDWLDLDPEPDEEEDPVARGIFAPIQNKGESSQPLNKWMRSVENAREAAERKRLFYVACTRAREELHLFAACERNKEGTLTAKPGSLLHAAWPAARQAFETSARVFQFPSAPVAFRVDSLAAATAESRPPRSILRIPALPAAREEDPMEETPAQPDRPEGSLRARIFGNTLHAFLERLARLLARRLAEPQAASILPGELLAWKPRITAVLRAGGMAPAELDGVANSVLKGLSNTLNDAHGRWLLQPHPGAASEAAVMVAGTDGAATSLRLDRVFLAGAAPGTNGTDTLWIVDFKTATHGPERLNAWLEEQRRIYTPQLEGYAAALTGAAAGKPIRLALFYPMLPRLIHWSFAPR
jgi:ATP-dependent exoDNAse (exonuclease V) beta subunit